MGVIFPFRPNKLAFPGGLARINPAHPASRNAVVAAVAAPGLTAAGPGATNFVNLVNGQMGTRAGSNNIRSVIFGPLGTTVFNDHSGGTTTDVTTFPGIYNSAGGGLTMSVIFSIQADMSASGNSLYLLTDGGAAPAQAIGTNIAVGYVNLEGFLGGNGIATNLAINSQTGPFGVPYFCVFSLSALSSLLTSVLVNLATGKTYVYFANEGGPVPTAGDGTIWIGNRNSARNWNGWIAAVSYSNTFLSLPQLLQWAQDPWSLWYPQTFDLVDMINTPTQPPPPVAASTALGFIEVEW